MAKWLTEKAVKRLRVKRRDYWVWDNNKQAVGLGLKVTAAGSKFFVLQLRFPGHRVQSRRTLGPFPGLGLAAAREKAQKWYGWVKQGIDPAHAEEAECEKQEAERRKEALKKANTFASVAEAYIAERGTHFRHAIADAREIRRLLIAEWGARPIHKITPRDVREVIHKIALRAPFDAKNAWGHAGRLFKYAVHFELIEVSPVASLDKALVFRNVKTDARQRVLSDDEVAAFWAASGEIAYPYGPFYRLLLLTGVRVNELGRAQWGELHPELRRLIRAGQPIDWSEVDNGVKIWTVPAARFKSGVDHFVPLSNDALSILESLPRFANCDFVFSTAGKKPINSFSQAKAKLDQGMLGALREAARRRGDDPDQSKLAPFVIHDLRRVVRTHLSALNVADVVAEMVLGHGKKGLQRIYDQHRYVTEQRDALEQWALRLRRITGETPTPPPENVVALKQKQSRR